MEAIRRRGLTGTALKTAAALLMAADHIGYSFNALLPAPVYWTLRGLGRPAFVIFAFFAVEGALRTRSPWRYLLRLFLFALVCEAPFDLMIYGAPFSLEGQNVLFTLLAGAGAVTACVKLRGRPVIASLICCAAAALAWGARTDYGALGVTCVVVLYLTRSDTAAEYIGTGIVMLGMGLGMGWPAMLLQLGGLAGLGMCGLYDGRRLRDGAGRGAQFFAKYFFYLFYPLHMLLLWHLRALTLAGALL